MKKSMKKFPKALRGALKQSDTMADKPTMGNPKAAKRTSKMREKRLEGKAM